MASVGDYHRKMLELGRTHGRPAAIEEVAGALGIQINEAVRLQNIVNNIKKDAKDAFDKDNRLQSDKLASLGHQPHQAPRDPNDPFSFGGRKSRRYSKKSGRKSRRHSKKSSKRSCRR